MKDQNGIYYLPDPSDLKTRVYVRPGPDGNPEFRLWRADRPEVWEKHGWVGQAAIEPAVSAYKARRAQAARSCPVGNPALSAADPARLYDLAVAKALLKFASENQGLCPQVAIERALPSAG
jgi:hypothetical protein